MKRVIAVIFLTLAPIAALVLVMAGETSPANNARAALDQYVAYKGYTLQVQQIVRATRPWNFSQDMSAIVVGDSARYRTDGDFSGNLRNEVTRFAAYSQTPYSPQSGRMPLPYPPQEAWCALLKHTSRSPGDVSDNVYAVVFMALHEDLYNGAWLMHEARNAPSTPELAEDLSRIGCNLKLNP